MRKPLILLLVGAAVLAGCNKETPEPVQTVDWYKAHKPERLATIEKCRNNPGQLAGTPNCINASRADAQAEAAKRSVPSVTILSADDFKKPRK